MAAVMATPSMGATHDEQIMDTRTPSPVHRPESNEAADTPLSDSYKPDLSAEVAMLSTKLVNAINYQTNLDDSLQQTRLELERAHQELQQARGELRAERAAREAAEKSKKQTEAELENLTVSLFEEANTMVAAARQQSEDAVAAVERKNSQLKTQLSDTELLLESQREQLSDLKATMERMERTSEQDSTSRGPSIPSTPVTGSHATFDAMHFSPHGEQLADVSPDHPLHFANLVAPVLRHDIVAYKDFQELLAVGRLYRGTNAHSRSTSDNHSNSAASTSQTNLASTLVPSPGLPGSFSFSGGTSPSGTTPHVGPPLKECKFYKRAAVEDLEPTLRLDLAPGLSFLSRRTVLSALLQGSLVVEPFTPHTKYYGPVFPCALCGESRKNEPYVRKHRFRTSEEESAQRYPLCDYCLARVRAAGDFVGFLRTVRDGHWRADTEEEQKNAWEESVRLRERMFWTRLGGGVVPVAHSNSSVGHDTRPSLDSIPEQKAQETLSVPEIMEPPATRGPRVSSSDDKNDAVDSAAAVTHEEEVSTPFEDAREDKELGDQHTISERANPEETATDRSPSSDAVGDDSSLPTGRTTTVPNTSTAVETAGENEEDLTTPRHSKRLSKTSGTALSMSRTPSPVKSLRSISPNKSLRSGSPSKSPERLTNSNEAAERRPSGVLARVRAMEAKAQAQAAVEQEKKTTV